MTMLFLFSLGFLILKKKEFVDKILFAVWLMSFLLNTVHMYYMYRSSNC